MRPRVLVTGASGFVGSAVLDEFEHLGVQVDAVSRSPPIHEKRVNVSWHRLDLLTGEVADALRRLAPTHCLHLAWEATPGRYRHSRANYEWVGATLRLAHSVFECGGGHFTMAGSCAEYALPAVICDEATSPLADDCAYAVCKVETSRLLTALARDAGKRFAIGRIFYVYGPGEPRTKLIASICRGLAGGEPVPLSAGSDVLDYVHLSDVAKALVSLTFAPVAGAVNIGTGHGISVRDVAVLLGRIAGRPELLQFGRRPEARATVKIVANIDRMVTELGFRPAVDLEQGLQSCYRYWTPPSEAGQPV